MHVHYDIHYTPTRSPLLMGCIGVAQADSYTRMRYRKIIYTHKLNMIFYNTTAYNMLSYNHFLYIAYIPKLASGQLFWFFRELRPSSALLPSTPLFLIIGALCFLLSLPVALAPAPFFAFFLNIFYFIFCILFCFLFSIHFRMFPPPMPLFILLFLIGTRSFLWINIAWCVLFALETKARNKKW